MNTEFPSRIPTVRRTTNSSNNSTSTVSTKTSDETSFQKEVSKVLKEGLKFLKSVTEKVSDLLDTAENNKTKKTTKTNKPASEGYIEKSFNVLKETMGTLKNLTDFVQDFFTNKLGSSINTPPYDTSTVDKSIQLDDMLTMFINMSERTLWFNNLAFLDKFKVISNATIKVIKNGFSALESSWNKGLDKLQYNIERTSETLGNTIGSVFGSGLFGNMISSIITKALQFAVSKVLVGMVLTNLPMTLLVGSIIAAIGLIVYYSKEIWEGIKWLGWSIDQGLDAIASIFGKSKYEEARGELAKQTGLSESDILDYYGDTVRGRNQALEDYRRSQTDEDFKKNLVEQIKRGNQEMVAKLPKYDSLQLSGERSTITQYYNNTTVNNDSFRDSLSPYSGDLALQDLPDLTGGMTNINNVSQIYNNTAVNTMGNNVYRGRSTNSISLNGPRDFGTSLSLLGE